MRSQACIGCVNGKIISKFAASGCGIVTPWMKARQYKETQKFILPIEKTVTKRWEFLKEKFNFEIW